MARTIRLMAMTLLLGLATSGHAEEDANWSSGVYRADPERSPFKIRPEPPRRQSWDDDEPVARWPNKPQPNGSEPQRATPPIWKPDRYQQHLSERNRPWGAIPSESDRYPPAEERDPIRPPAASSANPGFERWSDGPLPPVDERRYPPPDAYRSPPRDDRDPRSPTSPDAYRSPPRDDRDPRSPPAFWDGPYQKEYAPARTDWNRDSSGALRDDRSTLDPLPPREPPRQEDRWWGQRGDDRYWDEPGRNRYWPEER
ncbi:MAG: hypothetical protein HQL98_06295 [Magnetococcales bacterium]|nr:hypothetical protein [Magnetococcales bacterium]